MSIDPRQLPLDPGFDHLARGEALAPDRLTADALRRRFQHPVPWTPELTSDPRAAAGASAQWIPAAVLVLLIRRDPQLGVLLTHRSRHLPVHPGQISFPGGSIERSDRDAVDAALREAHEEIGLATAPIEILGTLLPYRTVTGFEVTAVVGMVAPPIELKPDAAEVEATFEVPLSFLMDPANHQRRLVMESGQRRFVYTMPYNDGSREHLIWGVTAALVRNLYAFLRAGED